jgi:hypothetical protein
VRCPFVTIVTSRRSVRCILSGCGEKERKQSESNVSEISSDSESWWRMVEDITLLILQPTVHLDTSAEV